MIRTVVGNEATQVGGDEAELLANAPPRPELDPLTVLRREGDLFAQCLFFTFRVGQVEPAARAEVTHDALLPDDALEELAVAHGHAKDQ